MAFTDTDAQTSYTHITHGNLNTEECTHTGIHTDKHTQKHIHTHICTHTSYTEYTHREKHTHIPPGH